MILLSALVFLTVTVTAATAAASAAVAPSSDMVIAVALDPTDVVVLSYFSRWEKMNDVNDANNVKKE